MTTLLVGSKNKGKIAELTRLLTDVNVVGVEVLQDQSDVAETAFTYLGNARLKGQEYSRRAQGLADYVLADDSGLAVTALNGSPGVFSARYAGESCTYQDNINKLLAELEPLQHLADRDAKFWCCLTLWSVKEQKEVFYVEDLVEGSIAIAPKGESGFGYDPVFLYEDRTFGEMTAEEKDLVSHRGKALRRLIKRIKNELHL